jgi:hypothetical protein
MSLTRSLNHQFNTTMRDSSALSPLWLAVPALQFAIQSVGGTTEGMTLKRDQIVMLQKISIGNTRFDTFPMAL